MKKLVLIFALATCAFAQKTPKPSKPGLYAVFDTDLGKFKVVLYEKDTPGTVAVFAGLVQGTRPWRDPDGNTVKKPYYDGLTFYRVIDGAIQTGSPTNKTAYNCGFTIEDEILPGLLFASGSLAMANGGPGTGSCQFFITTGPQKLWNGKFTIFGKVVEGAEVIEKIASGKVKNEAPVKPVTIHTATIERVGEIPKKK